MASFFTTKVETPKKPFRVISLDGGGVRAIIQCTILQRLVVLFPDLLSEVEMFAGTSAGGIVAGALAVGLTPDQTTHLWKQEVSKIFSQAFRHKVGTFDNAIGAAYHATELEKMLEHMIGGKKLKDLKPKFLSPAFRLDPTPGHTHNPRWHPVYFHNFAHSDNSDTKLVDVILRTAAAPTYFPIRDGFVDGGTYANNPALAAVTTAIASGMRMDEISVLSISTGLNPKSISRIKIGGGDWGLFEWGPHIIDLLLDSTTQSIDYECKCLLKDNYKRLDPVIPFDVGLDDSTALAELIKVANSVDITEIADWLEKNWMLKRVTVDPSTIPMEILPAPGSSSWSCSIQ